MSKMLKVGDHVIFHDSMGRPYNALVTAIHAYNDPDENGQVEYNEETGEGPCINVVFVTGNDSMQDQYGRQIHRETSISWGKTYGTAWGFYFRFPDEEPNPVRKSVT